jgi:Glycosyl hydrolases family 25
MPNAVVASDAEPNCGEVDHGSGRGRLPLRSAVLDWLPPERGA